MAFKTGQNPNHPRKGASIKVEPIRELEVIARIKNNLLEARQFRNYCLFTLGINTAWRANEILSLDVGRVRQLNAGDVLDLKQSKTGQYRAVALNQTAIEAIQLWLCYHPCKSGDNSALFPSRQFGRLGVPALCNLVKQWCKGAGANGQFGSHTLRKTWGYHQRVTFNEPLVLISRALGHTSEAQTLRYIGLLPHEVTELYRHEI
ncbi:MAG: tyrosine-type recombinase/integrase [Aestuariibacter sp.]